MMIPLRSLIPAAFAALVTTAQAADVCNGYASLCSVPYSNVSFVGAHDSPFSLFDGNEPSDNQDLSVSSILGLGIRYLQGQTHKNVFGTLDLCHTSCWLLDAGPLSDFLGTVKTFLDANPNEVVTLLLTNGDNLNVTDFDASFKKSGITNYTYTPATHPLPINSWPTLGQLIDAGTRLVTFLDYGADESRVPYILDEFSYYFETPFDVTDAADFKQCPINRPSGAKPEGRMYVVNHFLDKEIFKGLDVPDKDAANQTNAAQGAGSIGEQAAVCEGLYGRNPHVVFVDWVDLGEPLEAQKELNGLT